MLSLLPTTFGTLSTGTNSTVSSLIRQMKVSKYDVSQIIEQLSNFRAPIDFSAGRIAPGSTLTRQIITDMFRDSSSRVKLLFATANGVATAIGSMVEIFSSEIHKLEKDLNDLKIFIDNYEFLSGKDDFYNSSYVEKFDNLEGDYRSDGVSFRIPDRDGITFPLGANGFVDSVTGMFKVGKNYSNLSLLGRINEVNVSTNFATYVTSESDFENVFNQDMQNSWNVTVKSPVILSSFLSNYSQYINYSYLSSKAAEVVAEVILTSPVQIDTIRFNPNLSNGLTLLQVVAFNADLDSQESSVNQANYKLLLNQPILLKGTHEVSFSQMQVSKFIFIFSQKSYIRNKMVPINSEINSKIIQKFINLRSVNRRREFSKNQDMVLFYFNKRNSLSGFIKNKNQNKDYYSNSFPAKIDLLANVVKNQIMMIDNYDISDVSSLQLSENFQRIINSISFGMDRGNSFIQPSVHVGASDSSQGSFSISGISGSVRLPQGVVNDYKRQSLSPSIVIDSRRETLDATFAQERSDFYEYMFSVKSIELLNTVNDSGSVNKACFVTKKINTDGQPLAMKIKLDPVVGHTTADFEGLDIPTLSSYEVSVSNSNTPVEEDEWLPILPFNKSSIESEFVIFDISEYKYKTRFRAIGSSISLYRDGILCDPSTYSFSESSSTVRLLDNSLYSQSVIFTIAYEPNLVSYNPYEIDFIKTNIYKDSVKIYSSSFGSGQRFLRTGQSNSVKLEYIPFVNESYKKNSTYNSELGTIFIGSGSGYSPVKVRLNDGTYAINLTNYTNSSRPVQFYQSATPLFYVSGSNLVFDRKIDSTFFVEYSYIPNSVRIRVIMRKNVSSINMSDKIDTLIAKIKTINYDPYYDKLNFLSRIDT